MCGFSVSVFGRGRWGCRREPGGQKSERAAWPLMVHGDAYLCMSGLDDLGRSSAMLGWLASESGRQAVFGTWLGDRREPVDRTV